MNRVSGSVFSVDQVGGEAPALVKSTRHDVPNARAQFGLFSGVHRRALVEPKVASSAQPERFEMYVRSRDTQVLQTAPKISHEPTWAAEQVAAVPGSTRDLPPDESGPGSGPGRQRHPLPLHEPGAEACRWTLRQAFCTRLTSSSSRTQQGEDPGSESRSLHKAGS